MTAFDSAIIDAVESVITRFTPPGEARPAVSVNVRCNPEKSKPHHAGYPTPGAQPSFDGPPESIMPDNYDLDTDLESDAQCSAPANEPYRAPLRTMKVGDQVQLFGFKQIFTIFKVLPSSKEVKLFRIDAADEHKTLTVPVEAIAGFGR